MTEKANSKLGPTAGIMITLLFKNKKAKALIAFGATLLAIGFSMDLYFGAIVFNQASQRRLNAVT